METRREQIYQAAGALFRRRGYTATSIRDIARELDSHISSKEEVLWALVSGAAERFFDAARPIAESPAPAEARLRAMIAAHVGVVVGEIEQASVFLFDWKHLSAPHREAIGRQRDEYERLFRGVIADGIAEGTFAPTDPKLAATMVLSALNGVATWYHREGPVGAGQLAAQYADLLLGGLQRRDAVAATNEEGR
jgi:TetR/AcrR family transcriptional regulator, cholesterol catabolism regulator